MNNKYKNNKDIINNLIALSGGSFSSYEFDKLFEMIVEELSFYDIDLVSHNLFRILNALFDRVIFLKNSLKHPHYLKYLILISANSNYLTDVLVRNPEYIYLIFNNEFLSKKLTVENLKNELENNLKNYNNFDSKINVIRLFKRKYLLKIGVNDLIEYNPLKTTTLYLSYLAVAISDILFKTCLSKIEQKYNFPKINRKYALASLGKLGGNELNYSSDIDLIIFYDRNLPIYSKSKMGASEFFNETIQLFIKIATEISDKGYIYRVDFRLRPEGRNSALSNSIGKYLNYYETKGEDWERQMLLKLDFVGGDKNLYNEFYKFISSFIFAKSLFVSPLLQIKEMKKLIEIGNEDNIKLCKGGIRDIEFSIQALQLINGAKHKNLFDGNSLNVLVKLKDFGIINQLEYDNLTEAYIFYRKIEHFLQLMNDRQTHTIPKNGDTLTLLCKYLGFENLNEFNNILNNFKYNVRNFFASVFSDDSQIPEDLNTNIFDKINFKDKNRASKTFNYIRSGTDLVNSKGFDNKTVELFKLFELDLLSYLNRCNSPDFVLDNFSKGIRSVYFPSLWYNSFTDKQLLNIFLDLCHYSNRLFNIWIEDKKIGDLLLTGRIYIKSYISQNSNLSTNSLLFVISAQFALKIINAIEVGEYLSLIVKNKIIDAFNSLNISGFSVLGFGSFGTKSMNFASDIDLIFITKDNSSKENINKQAAELIKLLNSALSPFKFDFRLRPEGQSSQIVWNLKAFSSYLLNRARIWELQAFQKAMFICGDKSVFDELFLHYLKRLENTEKYLVASEIIEMHNKIIKQNLSLSNNIKYSNGAINDIDFLSQFAFFHYQEDVTSLAQKSFLERLKLFDLFFDSEDLNSLIENYTFLKNIEISLQNIFSVNNSNIPLDKDKLFHLSEFLNIDSVELLQKKINETLTTNQKIFIKYIGNYK